MRSTLFFLASVLSAGASTAQVSPVLLEACSRLETTQLRVDCLTAAGVVASNQSSWFNLEKAFTELEGAITSGVSYNEYQKLVIEVGKQLAVFEKSASATQPGVLQKLQLSLKAYIDAGSFWRKHISYFSGIPLTDRPGGLPMAEVGLEWMIGEYNLPNQRSYLWLLDTKGVKLRDGLYTIWARAAELNVAGFTPLKSPSAK